MIDNPPAFILAWIVVLVWIGAVVFFIDAVLEAQEDDRQ